MMTLMQAAVSDKAITHTRYPTRSALRARKSEPSSGEDESINQEDTTSEPEDNHEVEQIVDKVEKGRGSRKTVEYKVRFKDCDEKWDLWYYEWELPHARGVIADFESQHSNRPSKKSSPGHNGESGKRISKGSLSQAKIRETFGRTDKRRPQKAPPDTRDAVRKSNKGSDTALATCSKRRRLIRDRN